jgi:hypothetical protein
MPKFNLLLIAKQQFTEYSCMLCSFRLGSKYGKRRNEAMLYVKYQNSEFISGL